MGTYCEELCEESQAKDREAKRAWTPDLPGTSTASSLVPLETSFGAGVVVCLFGGDKGQDLRSATTTPKSPG